MVYVFEEMTIRRTKKLTASELNRYTMLFGNLIEWHDGFEVAREFLPWDK